MRHYLDLIPIQAKIHRKQSLMTRICIFLSVFLIMAIFGMADMEMVSQKIQAIQIDGEWHVAFRGLTDEQAALLAARPEVEVSSRYDVINYSLEEHWQLDGKETVVCGFDESHLQMFSVFQEETAENFPSGNFVLCSGSVRDQKGLQVGDSLIVTAPDGKTMSLTIDGFFHTTSMLTQEDAFGIAVDTETFRNVFLDGQPTERDFAVYVKFKPFCSISKTIADIQKQFGLSEDQTGENARLLGLMFQSRDPYLMQIYLVAAVLALLVAAAGVLMITGSLNSSVAQRTEFFGLMRCLGASPRQVMRFVKKEALGWCRTTVPAAILTGTIVIWGLCGILRCLSPNLFDGMPRFGISWIGIGAGTGIGILTVLLAAGAPAKRAAKVSPLAAVSGNGGTVHAVRRSAGTRWIPVDLALGIHHARGSLKNFLLMTGSFAFGIILFLSFSTLRDFMNHAFVPLQPWSPDLSVVSPDNTCSIPEELAGQYQELSFVKRAYGRSFAYGRQAVIGEQEMKINLISCESYQLDWAEAFLDSGTVDNILEGDSVLVVCDGANTIASSLTEASTILIETAEGMREIPVSGTLTYSPFDREPDTETVICSEKLFHDLTGENGYTIIDVQVKRGTTDKDAETIRRMAGERTAFSDRRQSNAEVMGAYYAFLLFLYGFLIVILMISSFHIINSMSMSVSARMKQYQNLHAIGMDRKKILRMITAEAFTYTVPGILLGGTFGLFLHRFAFRFLVTSHWGDPWQLPVLPLAAAILAVLLSTVLSLWGPGRRVRKMVDGL